jgi:plastocyanin
MKKALLILTLFFYAAFCKATIITITNINATFSPSLVTINDDDTVRFVLSSTHDAREVSQATWNANGNTALPGFQTPFTGGFVFPTQLTAGTHYYVCTPHASIGMKGRIIVNSTSGIGNNAASATAIKVFPNPFTAKVTVEAPGIDLISIYNILGMEVRTFDVKSGISSFELYTTGLDKGIYFFKFFKDGTVKGVRKLIKAE